MASKERDYDVVSSRAPGEKSQIVCIRTVEVLSAMSLYHHLSRAKNIVTAPRGDRLRIAPHFYNTLTEIDEFIKRYFHSSERLSFDCTDGLY
jgi:selenocysteine lyase/cysteine desulfurase